MTSETIAPPQYAAEWDNIGLLAGSGEWEADSILLTIDLTDAVLDEAVNAGAKLIVSYHPPIFQPLKSITDASPKQRIILNAIASRLAIYSPHTALDAAPDGINDWLAQAFGTGDVRALQSYEFLPESEQCKIVTFCPADIVDAVRNGLASVGAGQIGKYQLCSFELPGRGTFFAGDGAKPTLGVRGAMQVVDEVRLEMVCPKAALALALATLRQFHPYEEPAIDIYPLHSRPLRHIGHGRRVMLDQAVTLKSLAQRLKQNLGLKRLEVAVGHDAPARYTRIGVCAGAGGSLLQDAIDQGCQLFFTGELRHHDVLNAQAQGCTVVLAGHTNTERGYLKVLRKRLNDVAPDVNVSISRRDANPLRSM